MTDTKPARFYRRGVHSPAGETIYSRSHFLISVVVGIMVAAAVGATLPRTAFLIAYAGAVGVLIDLDHFLLARLNTGGWRAARACLADPSLVLLDQDDIFEDGEVGSYRRLLSHALIGGALVGGLALVDSFLAVFTAVVLYAHVVSDLVAEVREESRS